MSRWPLITDAAQQALNWSHALASPGRAHIGPNLIPCRLGTDEHGKPAREPIRGWKWKEDHVPGHEQSMNRLVRALRASTDPHPWCAQSYSIAPASDGLVVIDVDGMRHLPRVHAVFGPSPVMMISRSGKQHLYYQGPAVKSSPDLWGKPSIEVKAAGAMIHVAGDGARPLETIARAFPDKCTAANRGWLRRYLPAFRVDVYESILAGKQAARPARNHDGAEHVLSDDDARARGHAYMERAGPAVSGRGGHDHTRRVLLALGDIGVPEHVAADLAAEWDRDNEPPWGDAAIRAKIRDAYATRQDPVGCRARGACTPDGDDDANLSDEDTTRALTDAVAALN